MNQLATPSYGSVASAFWHNVLECGDQRAFLNVNSNGLVQALRWSQLGSLADEVISEFHDRDFPAGAHVANCLPNSLAWILIDIACQTLGLVHVAIDSRLGEKQNQGLKDFAEAEILYGDSVGVLPHLEPENAESWRDIAAIAPIVAAKHRDRAVSQSNTAPAQMLFTSGTVSAPKGVLLSNQNLYSNAAAKLLAAPQSTQDVRLNVLPFAHAFARTCELSSWILSQSQLALAHDWEDLIEQARTLEPTVLNLVPYLAVKMADLLDESPRGFGNRLRMLCVGGAAVDETLFKRLEKHGVAPLQGYGLTEASPVVCSNVHGRLRSGCVGQAVKGTLLRVDESGVLWVQGPQVMLGYWKSDSNERIQNGWLNTGDLAEIDAEGFVRILGRHDDQISLSSGFKVQPEQVEARLLRDPRIAQAVVFGSDRPYLGALLYLKGELSDRQAVSASECPLAEIERSLQCLFDGDLRHLRPARLALLPERMTAKDGLLSNKGTPRRPAIYARYRHLIDPLFDDRAS